MIIGVRVLNTDLRFRPSLLHCGGRTAGNKRLPNTILITFTRFSPLLHALSFKWPFAPRRGSAIELYVLIVLKLEVYVVLSLADICLFAT